MLDQELKRLKKILFVILGCRPHEFGVILDKGGWLSIKELHRVLRQETGFSHISLNSLKQFFPLYKPEIFEWQENRVRVIWELQHPDINKYTEAVPPEWLYIGIRQKGYSHTIIHGLKSDCNSKWIVLSAEKEMAFKIGLRRDNNPIILEIMALKSSKAGAIFKKAGENLYIVKDLDPQWINKPFAFGQKKTVGDRRKSVKVHLGTKKITKNNLQPLEQIGGFVLRKIPSLISEAGFDKENNKSAKLASEHEKKKIRYKKRGTKYQKNKY